jgi:uncharacterized protein (TIGR04376 family)
MLIVGGGLILGLVTSLGYTNGDEAIMSLLDDVKQFLETRLEEFLRAHPDLELQALEEQLRQQEADAVGLIAEGRAEEQRLQKSIVATAEEIKTWHLRVEKAVQANRTDLAQGARDRETALLSQGNQLWGQMKGIQQRTAQMEILQRQIQQRRQEVKVKLDQLRAQQRAEQKPEETFSGWNKPSDPWDELEKKFRELEVDLELKNLQQKS